MDNETVNHEAGDHYDFAVSIGTCCMIFKVL